MLLQSDDPSVAAYIPAPGHFVSVSAYGEQEATEDTDLFIVTDEDGLLSYEATTSELYDSDPGACQDEAFNLLGYKMVNDEKYFINLSTIPDSVDRQNTLDAIDSGMRAWPQQFTDCDIVDKVSRTIAYGGNTESVNAVQVGRTADGTLVTYCADKGENTTSVISFGYLAAEFGATCRYGVYQDGTAKALGADIKLHSDLRWTFTPNADSCENRIDIQSIATHEAGHWWGMAHVSASRHPNLTMRNGGTAAVNCNGKLRTLGRGDLLGMRALF